MQPCPPSKTDATSDAALTLYGFRITSPDAFRLIVPNADAILTQHTLADGAPAWILWDVADPERGYMLVGESMDELRGAFRDYAINQGWDVPE